MLWVLALLYWISSKVVQVNVRRNEVMEFHRFMRDGFFYKSSRRPPCRNVDEYGMM